MWESLARVEARIAVLEQRLAALDPVPASPATGANARGTSFAEVLAAEAQQRGAGVLPPAPVDYASRQPLSPGEPPLPPPPHWIQQEQVASDPEDAVIRAARRHGVAPSLAAAVARAESGFNPQAVSKAGALGLMQLMPATARALGVTDPFDPEQNADGGVRYLAEQIQRFGDVRLALAAYNAGPSRVAACGDVPPIAETQRYVQRVLEFQRQYREAGYP